MGCARLWGEEEVVVVVDLIVDGFVAAAEAVAVAAGQDSGDLQESVGLACGLLPLGSISPSMQIKL